MIRNCDNLNRLLELNLYITVLTNTHPDFSSDPQTSWTMAVNDTVSYKLPGWSDPEGNDNAEIYVSKMDGQETKYPPFMLFENSTNTINFRPRDFWDSGENFFFSVVIKESNSDSVLYSYYCTVTMLGEKFDKEAHNVVHWVDVSYDILDINSDSTGAMLFSEPVNMTYLEQHFYFMFKVFYRDISYRENKEDKNLVNFVVDHYGWQGNNSIVNFTMEFEKPYLLGLLLKKSDKLYINRRDYDDFNATEFFLSTSILDLPDYEGDVVYRGNSSWH